MPDNPGPSLREVRYISILHDPHAFILYMRNASAKGPKRNTGCFCGGQKEFQETDPLIKSNRLGHDWVGWEYEKTKMQGASVVCDCVFSLFIKDGGPPVCNEEEHRFTSHNSTIQALAAGAWFLSGLAAIVVRRVWHSSPPPRNSASPSVSPVPPVSARINAAPHTTPQRQIPARIVRLVPKLHALTAFDPLDRPNLLLKRRTPREQPPRPTLLLLIPAHRRPQPRQQLSAAQHRLLRHRFPRAFPCIAASDHMIPTARGFNP